jgi:hypothetical protein
MWSTMSTLGSFTSFPNVKEAGEDSQTTRKIGQAEISVKTRCQRPSACPCVGVQAIACGASIQYLIYCDNQRCQYGRSYARLLPFFTRRDDSCTAATPTRGGVKGIDGKAYSREFCRDVLRHRTTSTAERDSTPAWRNRLAAWRGEGPTECSFAQRHRLMPVPATPAAVRP